MKSTYKTPLFEGGAVIMFVRNVVCKPAPDIDPALTSQQPVKVKKSSIARVIDERDRYVAEFVYKDLTTGGYKTDYSRLPVVLENEEGIKILQASPKDQFPYEPNGPVGKNTDQFTLKPGSLTVFSKKTLDAFEKSLKEKAA